MPKRLARKVAIVTGAGSGFGRAIAARLAEEGAAAGVAEVTFALWVAPSGAT